MASVTVKWQKESYSVDIDLSKPPSVFKTQLFSLTGVPPERQKIIGFKGGLLKDDADWSAAGAKDGLKLTMMGTAAKAPTAPQKEQIFLEDLPVEEQDTTGLSKYGAGLENLGNTCYMNSTLQCLYNVPELKARLIDFKQQDSTYGDQSKTLTHAAGALFSQMERSAQPVSPMSFVMTLRGVFPQFDQRSREGFHMQQDAEECWGSLLHAMKGSLSIEDPSISTDEIQRLFGIKTKSVLKCEETDETMEVRSLDICICTCNGSYLMLPFPLD
jgi:ubiquitin carboxyl-terminal hydrolase 14